MKSECCAPNAVQTVNEYVSNVKRKKSVLYFVLYSVLYSVVFVYMCFSSGVSVQAKVAVVSLILCLFSFCLLYADLTAIFVYLGFMFRQDP